MSIVCRYVSNMRQAEKLRKPVAKWWGTTLRPLRAAEIHATSSHLSSQTATAPHPNESPLPSHALAAVGSARKLRQEVGCTVFQFASCLVGVAVQMCALVS